MFWPRALRQSMEGTKELTFQFNPAQFNSLFLKRDNVQ